MDISGLGASKLLEALEKLGVSKGAELRSLGPQGEPPAELVRAFEDALRAPDGQGGPSVQGVAEGSREHGPFEEAGQDIPEVTRTDEAIPPDPSEDPVYGISEGSRIDGIGGTMRIESPSGPQAVEGRTDAVPDGRHAGAGPAARAGRRRERFRDGVVPAAIPCGDAPGTGHGRGEVVAAGQSGF